MAYRDKFNNYFIVSELDGDTLLLLGDFDFLSLFLYVSCHPRKVPLIPSRSTGNDHNVMMCSYSRPVTDGGNLTYFVVVLGHQTFGATPIIRRLLLDVVL